MTDSSPYLVRLKSADSQPKHRASLSPPDAATASRRRSSRLSESTASGTLCRKLNVESLESVRTSKRPKSADFIRSRRSSNIYKESKCHHCSHSTTPQTSSTFSFRAKTAPRSKTRTSAFKQLPLRVQGKILDELRELHVQEASPSCLTCYMRDLVSLRRASRSWEKAVEVKLYERIAIASKDSPAQLRQYETKQGSRLRLLRRTLRERGSLARLVKELNISDSDITPYLSDGSANPEFSEYRDLVASLAMICPNLECLMGFYTIYNHEFDRLTHALSTRERLKQHVWIIGDNEAVRQRSLGQLPPGLLDEHQSYQFWHHHRLWSRLETLMMCSPGRSGVIEQGLFVEVFQQLPSLKHLCVSSFDVDDFTDQVLLALPPLISLRVEECPGISDHGLSRFAGRPAAQSLENLALIHQNVSSLLALSKILAAATQLLKFTIVQSDVVPSISEGEVVFQPVLASASLRHMHWEISGHRDFKPSNARSPQARKAKALNTPNTYLALSIVHSGFPSLISLRAPQDISPPGALQKVCKPTKDAQILLPGDRLQLPAKYRSPNARMPKLLPLSNSLPAARIRAQGYIDSTYKNKKEFVKVIVTDHSDYDMAGSERSSGTSSQYSRASSHYSSASTIATDPGDLSLPEEASNVITTTTSKNGPKDATSLSDLSAKTISLPPSGSSTPSLHHSYAVRTTSHCIKVDEFSLPSFVGRVATSTATSQARPPKFHLLPDIPGYDAGGGLVGWADLLKIKEKANISPDQDAPSTTGSVECSGMWNKSHPLGPDWWKHVGREKGDVSVLRLEHFF